MDAAFQKAVPVLEKIIEAGYEAYFVGGSVRDYLLGLPINDVDIATSASPEEIKSIFPKTIDVGIEHGTVIVLHNHEAYEITTFRTEGKYEDYRRPSEVHFVRSLEEDLRRRDFTMNAIAMDKDGKIIDPFGGARSIEKKEIVTVGDPGERFHEDALRMMRALRFASKLSFSIHPSTIDALKKYGHLLKKISVERICTEFEKLLLGKNYQKALQIMVETKLHNYLPCFYQKGKEILAFSKYFLGENFSIEEYWTFLLFQFQLEENEIGPFLKKWKLSNKKISRVKHGLIWLKKRLEQDWDPVSLYDAKKEIALSTEKLVNILNGREACHCISALEERYEALPIKDRSELAVTGKDLMEWRRQRGGPWIETLLRKIEKAVILKEVINDKARIKEMLASCNQL